MRSSVCHAAPVGRVRVGFWPWRLRCVAALVLTACSPWALGQPSANDAAVEVPSGPGARAMLADELVRRALAPLESGSADPRVAGPALRESAATLDLALGLDPSAAEVWRLRAEAAARLGDAAARREALAAYVKLEPSDQHAKLAFLRLLIDDAQTLDGRIKGVDNLLRSRLGKNLADPLKAALAAYAAQMCRELALADEERGWLRRARRWDEANPEAARLNYSRAVLDGEGPEVVGARLVDWVVAQPLQLDPRAELARLLMDQAAYRSAITLYGSMERLIGAGALPSDLYVEWGLSLVALGEDALFESLMARLRRLAAGEEFDPFLAGGPGAADGADPEVERALPLELRLLELRTLSADRAVLGQRFERLRGDLVAHARERPGSAAQLAQWVAWCGPDPSEAVRLAEDWGVAGMPLDAVAAAAAARAGDVDNAKRFLSKVDDDSPSMSLARALVVRVDGRISTSALRETALAAPRSLGGALAARQSSRNSGDFLPGAKGRFLEEAVNRVPLSVWRLDVANSPWISYRTEVMGTRVGWLGALEARVEVINSGPVAVALGPGRTVSGRSVLQPRLSGLKEGEVDPPPVVVDLARRLTLRPGQRFDVRVRLDRRSIGRVLRDRPDNSASFDLVTVTEWQAAEFGPEPGPLGSMEIDRGVLVDSARANEASIESWLRGASGSDSTGRFRALARLIRLGTPGGGEAPEAMTGRIVAELSKAQQRGDAAQRAWIAAFAASADTSLGRELARAAFDDPDPLVRATVLLASDLALDDPRLRSAWRADADAQVVELARALRDRLTAEAEVQAETPQDADATGEPSAAGRSGDPEASVGAGG
ncbi:MAG: hypothetical protein AAF288_12325 [Planctomycetota bacterium]